MDEIVEGCRDLKHAVAVRLSVACSKGGGGQSLVRAWVACLGCTPGLHLGPLSGHLGVISADRSSMRCSGGRSAR